MKQQQSNNFPKILFNSNSNIYLKIEPIYVENVEENLPPVTNEEQMPEQSEHQIGQNIIKVKFHLIQILR